MRPIRLALFLSGVLTLGGAAFGGGQALAPETARALVQAKSVYVVTGHVRYFKPKHLVQEQLVDSTPFTEPTQKEMDKWGRFKLVSDPKQADLIIRVYAKVTGPVGLETTYAILDVVQPSSGRILWFDAKNDRRSWSTKTEVAGLVKDLRAFIEEQEKSGPSAQPGAAPNSPQIVPQAASAPPSADASSAPAAIAAPN